MLFIDIFVKKCVTSQENSYSTQVAARKRCLTKTISNIHLRKVSENLSEIFHCFAALFRGHHIARIYMIRSLQITSTRRQKQSPTVKKIYFYIYFLVKQWDWSMTKSCFPSSVSGFNEVRETRWQHFKTTSLNNSQRHIHHCTTGPLKLGFKL